jgi:hydrogenase nickel incorporation protein HypA/HybF
VHELSLAMQIQQTVLKAAAEHEVQGVVEVDIEIGRLSLFNPEQVEFWLRHLFRDTIAEDAAISVTPISPVVECRECGYEGSVEVPSDPAFHIFMPALRCPRCDSSDLTIEGGRDVVIKNLRVQKIESGGAHA